MIIVNNEEALRVKCEDVLPDEVGPLIEKLESELAYANKEGRGGIGLAAPQIGIAKNIAIVRLNKNYDLNFNLVNCRIKEAYDSAIFRQEGCLSFPGRVEDTFRFQETYITDNLVEPYSFVATGLIAVVCQHEIDHFNSKLFIDHIVPKIETTPSLRVKPNDPCLCKSGKKFKKCCGRKNG